MGYIVDYFVVIVLRKCQKLTDKEDGYVIFQLLDSSTDLPLTVVMFHYTSWPDHGVPDYAGPLLNLRKEALKRHKNAKGPILVHCRQVHVINPVPNIRKS